MWITRTPSNGRDDLQENPQPIPPPSLSFTLSWKAGKVPERRERIEGRDGVQPYGRLEDGVMVDRFKAWSRCKLGARELTCILDFCGEFTEKTLHFFLFHSCYCLHAVGVFRGDDGVLLGSSTRLDITKI